jgi:alpha-D-ribose 1-methylphosphonate 5-triphosphate synthase subunit PhnG
MTTVVPSTPRADWMRYWTSVPADRVRELARHVVAQYQVEDLEIPQSGLALVPLVDGALGERYYLGEIPLAKAHVRLTNQKGTAVEGAAIVMDDRANLTRALAILDGVLAAEWPGHEQAVELLREGETAVRSTYSDRKKLLAATRVDFSLLGTEEGDDD